jgi:hypothetical protein
MTQWWDLPTNVTNSWDYMVWVDSLANNLLGNILILAVFIISFVAIYSSSGEQPEKTLVASGFISSVIGILLLRIGIVDFALVYVCVFLTIVGFIWSFSRRGARGI